jgi:hypothetical protein
MSLDQSDRELIKRIVYKNGGDIAEALGRNFERLEERIDAAEARIYGGLLELDHRLEASAIGSAD